MPSLCPTCLGSGVTLNRGGYWQFASGASSRCSNCGGKGWLEDPIRVDSRNPVEQDLILDLLKQNSPANIDDIVRISGLDIPTVHRALVSLKDKGLVGVKDGSPVLYYHIKQEP
jgi:predicted Rossmann fold nucleotide-binding protein DprA/Smf involved in DNA uptake